MADLTLALVPAFAAGVALQRAIEIVDVSFVDREPKKAIIGWVSVVLGVLFVMNGHILILKALGVVSPMDYVISVLVVSAGTEGVNSILKLLGYKKDEAKNPQPAKVPAGEKAPGEILAAKA